ncbi:MAG: hypothetical protein ONB44_16085 [candidate division KSB1 bacterium]|nr:hypothetical protein [candidate division KSB1 bacterium]MDZ7303653.1 hypothetical protein [candidate division KSB1 bacterium]MDZ7313327.1 hypothetical protein [candidate division KSB1 bacterium]
MIEEKYIELINREIDGVNSPQDTAKLRDYLAQNAEAKQLYDELVATANLLQAVEPSPNLKKRVMSSIRPDRYAVKERTFSWGSIRNVAQAFFGAPAPQLKYAYAFAFGLMAGVCIYALLSSTSNQQASLDMRDLTGTMIWREATGKFERADSATADLDIGHASILVQYAASSVIAELNINTSQEVKAQLEFEENDLGFSAISMLNKETIPALSVNENSVQLINRGNNNYVIAFKDKAPIPSLLRFRLFAAGALLYEKNLRTAK